MEVKLQGDTVSYAVSPFIHRALCVSVLAFTEGSSVWFKASGFCYTTNAALSLGHLLDILLLPCVVEILQLWEGRICSFMCSSKSQEGWTLGLPNS